MKVPAAARPPGEWMIGEHSATLSWEKKGGAGPFFDRLFSLAFQVQEGIIYLPGSVRGTCPTP